MIEKNECILSQPIMGKNGVIIPCQKVHEPAMPCMDCIMLHGASGHGGIIGEANVPRDYRLLTAQTSPVRNSQADIYKVIDKYIVSFKKMFEEGLPKEERIRSLYLYSEEPGTGKTATATALLNEYIIRHYIGSMQKGLKLKRRIGYFLDINEWQQLYVGFTRPNVPTFIAEEKSEAFYTQLDLAKQAQFVVLDDLAVRTSVSDAFRGELHSLINYRITNLLPTVYTSNVPLDELPDIFGEKRLYDRVRHYCIQLNFEGDSKRGIKK